MTEVELWCDGSGTRGKPIGWAYVLVYRRNGEEIIKEGCGGEAVGTNNRAEMTALLMGLRALKRPCTVTIISDSEYVINPFRKGWLANWQKRGFRKVANSDLWQQIIIAAAPHTITCRHVRGHTGVRLNERCDQLAGEQRRAWENMELEFANS